MASDTLFLLLDTSKAIGLSDFCVQSFSVILFFFLPKLH